MKGVYGYGQKKKFKQTWNEEAKVDIKNTMQTKKLIFIWIFMIHIQVKQTALLSLTLHLWNFVADLKKKKKEYCAKSLNSLAKPQFDCAITKGFAFISCLHQYKSFIYYFKQYVIYHELQE